ncbi:MAG: NAD(P)H-dependent oxidoreductase [Prolixibacteraceae bacterium]|jgi:nitroreductase|nr:NAD(P)H-dependent oxidoreductase [Prolixibacteraceae bacterium]
MALLEQLNKRYATKKFDASKKIAPKDLSALLEAVRLSASSYGLQAYKVVVVEDATIRKQLRAVAWDQSQITDASQLLVFAFESDFDEKGVDRFVQNIAETRKVDASTLSGYSDMMKGTLKRPKEEINIWLARQPYIALGFGLVAAAGLNIDTCPMEGFDPDQFDEILGLKSKGLKSVVLLAVGYRSAEDDYQHLAKVRRSNEEFFITI